MIARTYYTTGVNYSLHLDTYVTKALRTHSSSRSCSSSSSSLSSCNFLLLFPSFHTLTLPSLSLFSHTLPSHTVPYTLFSFFLSLQRLTRGPWRKSASVGLQPQTDLSALSTPLTTQPRTTQFLPVTVTFNHRPSFTPSIIRSAHLNTYIYILTAPHVLLRTICYLCL